MNGVNTVTLYKSGPIYDFRLSFYTAVQQKLIIEMSNLLNKEYVLIELTHEMELVLELENERSK